MVAAFFSEGGSNGSTFLLDNGPLVGDGLCGANIADELLDCGVRDMSASADSQRAGRPRPLGHLRELMLKLSGPARGPGSEF